MLTGIKVALGGCQIPNSSGTALLAWLNTDVNSSASRAAHDLWKYMWAAIGKKGVIRALSMTYVCTCLPLTKDSFVWLKCPVWTTILLRPPLHDLWMMLWPICMTEGGFLWNQVVCLIRDCKRQGQSTHIWIIAAIAALNMALIVPPYS